MAHWWVETGEGITRAQANCETNLDSFWRTLLFPLVEELSRDAIWYWLGIVNGSWLVAQGWLGWPRHEALTMNNRLIDRLID